MLRVHYAFIVSNACGSWFECQLALDLARPSLSKQSNCRRRDLGAVRHASPRSALTCAQGLLCLPGGPPKLRSFRHARRLVSVRRPMLRSRGRFRGAIAQHRTLAVPVPVTGARCAQLRRSIPRQALLPPVGQSDSRHGAPSDLKICAPRRHVGWTVGMGRNMWSRSSTRTLMSRRPDVPAVTRDLSVRPQLTPKGKRVAAVPRTNPSPTRGDARAGAPHIVDHQGVLVVHVVGSRLPG